MLKFNLYYTKVTDFSSSGGGGVPVGGGGRESFVLPVYRYHPARWAPLLPGGGKLSYYLRSNRAFIHSID